MKKASKSINRKHHLFDAEGKILGRLATEIVKFLRGKNKLPFSPNVDGGDCVVVINSDRIRVTGNKATGKIYHRFSGYPGGVSSIKLKDQIEKDSTKVIQQAVYGMLPKNKLRKKMMVRLSVFKGADHKNKIDVTH